jgi:hypothetical protein
LADCQSEPPPPGIPATGERSWLTSGDGDRRALSCHRPRRPVAPDAIRDAKRDGNARHSAEPDCGSQVSSSTRQCSAGRRNTAGSGLKCPALPVSYGPGRHRSTFKSRAPRGWTNPALTLRTPSRTPNAPRAKERAERGAARTTAPASVNATRRGPESYATPSATRSDKDLSSTPRKHSKVP